MNTPVTMTLEPLRRLRAFEEIADQIREQLRTGNYAPGQRLSSEREMCERFQVSRNTLREALRSLENAGVIQSRKGAGGGMFVARMDGSSVINGLSDMCAMKSIKPADLIQARIWIESTVIRNAADSITEQDYEALGRNLDDAEAAMEAKDFDRRVEINLDFHRLLAKATGNQVVILLVEALLQATHNVLRTIGPYDNSFIPRGRRQFLKLLKAGETEEAVKTMERQLARMQKLYFSKLEP